MKKKRSLLFTSFLLNLSLIGMEQSLPTTEEPLTIIFHKEQLPSHWGKSAFTTSTQQQNVIHEAPQTILEEIFDMNDMERLCACKVAQAYRTWLGERSNTSKNKINFIKENNKQKLTNFPIEGTRQITTGLILLTEEEAQQKDLEAKRKQSQASSATVNAYLLKQDLDKKTENVAPITTYNKAITLPENHASEAQSTSALYQEKIEEPIVQSLYTQAPLPSSATSPKTEQRTSPSSSGKTTPLWTPSKRRTFDDKSPLMKKLESDPNFLLTTIPTSPPDDEIEIPLKSDDELKIFFIENNYHSKTQPANALPIPIPIPMRSTNKRN